MDVEVFINEVQKRPVLWDTSNEEYKDRNKKTTAWCQVAASMFIDFDTKLEAEQKVIIQNIMSKWKSVRDNFIRNEKKKAAMKKSGSGAKKLPHYIYEEQLRFLYKTREMRPTEASHSNNGIEEDGDISNDMHDDTITNDENADDTDTETVVEASEVPQNLSTPKINRKRKKSNIDDKVSMFIDATLKRQKEKEETNTKENVDDDMAFFSSLLPTVKSLTNDDKLQFRIDVLQLLQRYKAKPQRTANIHQPPFSSPGNDYLHDNNNYAYSSQRTYMELGSRPSSSSTGSYFSEFSSE